MPRKPIQSGVVCSQCESPETSKAGFTKNKKQRFYCRSCRRFFRENPVSKSNDKKLYIRAGKLPSAGSLVLQLIAISQSLGRTPTTADISALSKKGRAYSLNTYMAVFGSFTKALKKAHLPLRYNQEFDKEKLIDELRLLHSKLKKPLLGRHVLAAREKGLVSPIYHFQRAFGSVPKAIADAGAGRKKYTRKEMISFLRELNTKLERPALKEDIDLEYRLGDGPNSRAVEREFGGMAKARLAAGVRTTYWKQGKRTRQWQKYTPEELLVQLKALGTELGRKPTDRDMNRASKQGKCASAVTFARMFGSLPEAYRRSGYEQVKPRQYTDREIRSLLKKLIKELSRMPTFHELEEASKEGKCPSPGTILRRLGKLSDLKQSFA